MLSWANDKRIPPLFFLEEDEICWKAPSKNFILKIFLWPISYSWSFCIIGFSKRFNSLEIISLKFYITLWHVTLEYVCVYIFSPGFLMESSIQYTVIVPSSFLSLWHSGISPYFSFFFNGINQWISLFAHSFFIHISQLFWV